MILASRKGFEPLTYGLGNRCSILLSYRDARCARTVPSISRRGGKAPSPAQRAAPGAVGSAVGLTLGDAGTGVGDTAGARGTTVGAAAPSGFGGAVWPTGGGLFEVFGAPPVRPGPPSGAGGAFICASRNGAVPAAGSEVRATPSAIPTTAASINTRGSIISLCSGRRTTGAPDWFGRARDRRRRPGSATASQVRR